MKPLLRLLLAFWVAILLCHPAARAQNTPVIINIAVLPPYQQSILDFQTHPERIALTLTNTSNTELNLQLGGSISNDGNIRIQTKPGKRGNQPVRLGALSTISLDGTTISQLLDFGDLDFIGISRADLERTGMLPEGNYRICLRAYDFRTMQPLSALNEPLGCSNIFPVESITPPVLLNPVSESTVPVLAGTQNVIINWTVPPGLVGRNNIQYVLRMVEVLGNRNPIDAMMSNSVTPFFETTTSIPVFVYNSTYPQLVLGRKYALMVTARDPSGNTVFRNGGSSAVSWFQYGTAAVAPPPAPDTPAAPAVPFVIQGGNCVAACKLVPPTGVNSNATVQVNDVLGIGKFSMTVLAVQAAGGKISGTGTIPVPLLNSGYIKLRVAFQDVVVNADKKIMSGKVNAIAKSGSPTLVPAADAPSVAPPNVAGVMSFLANNPAQKIADAAAGTVNSIGLEMPLGLDIGPFMFAVTQVVFTPEQAWFTTATKVDIPESAASDLVLAGTACFQDAQGLCGPMKLFLAQDLSVPAIGLNILKAGNDQQSGTFIVATKGSGGFSLDRFNVQARYTFPANTLVDAQTRSSLSAAFNMDIRQGWNNWIAAVKLPNFYVSGAQKFQFSMDTVYWDHSDVRNPAGIPAEFRQKQGNDVISTTATTWRGWYFPRVAIQMPQPIKAANNPQSTTTVQAKDMIYTGGAFSGNVSATSLLSIGDGSLAGWYASIDTLEFDFWKNTLSSSRMIGRMVLPPSGSDYAVSDNQLQYTCLLVNNDNRPMDFQFAIQPKENRDLAFKVWYMKLRLDGSSQISVRTKADSSGDLVAQANLNGVLGIDDKDQRIPGIVAVSMPDIEFTNLGISTEAPYVDTNMKIALKFNSPDKQVGGFTMTLKSSGMIFRPGAETKIGIGFTGGMHVVPKSVEKLGMVAEAKFGIYARIKPNLNGRFQWEGVGAEMSEISMAAGADLGPFKVKGALQFVNKDADPGRGSFFAGALEVVMPADIKVKMRAKFGTAYDAQGHFEYFDMDALVDLGNTGIPAFGPISLYGFGGGMSINEQMIMNNTQMANSPKVDPARLSAEALLQPIGGMTYQPQRGDWSLKATILFGLAQRNTLDADATLSIGVSQNGGVTVGIDGTVRIVVEDLSAPLSSRNDKSLGFATFRAFYENDIFDLTAAATVGFPMGSRELIAVQGGLHLNVGGGGFFLHVGRPQSPATVDLLKLNGNYLFHGQTYFECGTHEIDPMPPPPQFILDMAGNEKYKMQPQSDRSFNPAQYEGIIHGSMVRFGFDSQFLIFFGKLTAGMGYDIAYLRRLDGSNFCANGESQWYAKGRGYIGAGLAVGIDVDLFFVSGRFTIFDAAVGAIIEAGLPSPTYCEGKLFGHYNILDGLVSGNFNFQFVAGDKCKPPKESNPFGMPIISDFKPAQNDVEITEVPQINFNLNVDSVYDLKFQNSDGSAAPTRRFMLSKNQILIELKNNRTNTVYRTANFVKGSSSKLLELKIDSLLRPRATYTLKITANLLEAANLGNNNFSATFRPAMQNGNPVTETREFTFTTNEGLTKVPNGMLVNSAPLHGHRSFPYAMGETNHYLQFTQALTLSYFKWGADRWMRLFAKVYKNGETAGQEVPVTVVGNQWRIPKQNLEPATQYRVDFLIQNDLLANRQMAQIQVVRGLTKTWGDGNSIKSTNQTVQNLYKEGTYLVAYYEFTTSTYPTYTQKLADLEIDKIILKGAYNNNVFVKSAPTQNAAAFFNVAISSGNGVLTRYTIRSKRNEIYYTGKEAFMVADLRSFTPDDIWRNGKTTPNNTALITTYQNTTAEATDWAQGGLRAMGVWRAGGNPNSIRNFISECTGVSANTLDVNLEGTGCNTPAALFNGTFKTINRTYEGGSPMEIPRPNNLLLRLNYTWQQIYNPTPFGVILNEDNENSCTQTPRTPGMNRLNRLF